MAIRMLTAPLLTVAMVFAVFTSATAQADPLMDPPVFTSARGSLDLVIVAKPVPISLANPTPSGSSTTQAATDQAAPATLRPTAWVYEVCPRTAPQQNACQDGSAHPLGGVRLQLNPGDTLKIRLVNRLPPATDAKHVADNPALFGNPTNLHTHGLIVEPHRAEGPNDTYGDYVFLQLLNPDNPTSPPAAAPAPTAHAGHDGGHPDMDTASGAVDYAILIPANHPSGLFWFHPHMHGVALNQVSAGMAGIITIGAPDQLCGDAKCADDIKAGAVRHLVLKDMQVLGSSTLQSQQDPDFCGGADQPATPPARGACPGVGAVDPGYAGGAWFHTVNGQVFPTIDVSPAGDIWRIVNASGSRSYELSLGDEADKPVLMQIMSIDGVTVDSLALDNRGREVMQRLLGGKAKPVPCPKPAGYNGPDGLCTTILRLMPSARAEVRVVRQGASRATLRTALYFTGGDSWPAIDLAQVQFGTAGPNVLPPLALGMQGRSAMSESGALLGPAELQPRGSLSLVDLNTARAAAQRKMTDLAAQGNLKLAPSIAIDPALKLGLRRDPECAPLNPGHHRRIFFGNPTPGQDGFGLGYVEVDEKGREIEATRKAIQVFDPTKTTICLPLEANGKAVKEVWELLNLTDEDHNFHIHQTRFRLLAGGTVPGQTLPSKVEDGLVLHDNVPLPRATNTDSCDGSVDAFARGVCRPTPVVVEIPFREVGDFVFHCHILEHEDGGMMARIRVVAPPM